VRAGVFVCVRARASAARASSCVRVCACVRVCVRVRARVFVCMRALVRARVCVCCARELETDSGLLASLIYPSASSLRPRCVLAASPLRPRWGARARGVIASTRRFFAPLENPGLGFRFLLPPADPASDSEPPAGDVRHHRFDSFRSRIRGWGSGFTTLNHNNPVLGYRVPRLSVDSSA
jgi:hypothetical protein